MIRRCDFEWSIFWKCKSSWLLKMVVVCNLFFAQVIWIIPFAFFVTFRCCTTCAEWLLFEFLFVQVSAWLFWYLWWSRMGSLLFDDVLLLLLWMLLLAGYSNTCAGCFYSAHYYSSWRFIGAQSWRRLLFLVLHLTGSTSRLCNFTLLWLGSGGPRAFSSHGWGGHFVTRYLRFAIYRPVLGHSSSGHLLSDFISISLRKPSFNLLLPCKKLRVGWWFLCRCKVVFVGHISSEIR